MFAFILTWLILSVAIWATAYVLPGVRVDGIGAAIGVAAVFGALNFLFGWLAFVVIGVATLGLGFLLFFITEWIVNAILLSATDRVVSGFHLESFGTSLLASLLISAFAAVGHWVVF